jgi:hypothetical protein
MSVTHTEIVDLLAGEIEQIARACIGRVQRRKRLDEEDDDYASLVDLLDRWGDRKVPKVN